MGRIAEMILRGEQHAVQRESADLDRVTKQLHLEDYLQERAAERAPTTPRELQAFEKFTDPDTTTEELGALASLMKVIDIPKAKEFRQERLLQRIRRNDEMATIAMRARVARELEEQQQAGGMEREQLEQQGATERTRLQQQGADTRTAAGIAARGNEEPPGAKPLTPAQEKSIVSQARESLLRDKLSLSSTSLESVGKKVGGVMQDLPPELAGITKEEITQRVEQASLKVLDLVRSGMVLEDAIEEAGMELDHEQATESRMPFGIGDTSASFKEADSEVDGMLKSAGWADTPENRSKVKAFLQKKKGG